MRNYKSVRAVRWDPAIIEYGNDLCKQLSEGNYKGNMCTQFLRLGRLKLILNIDELKIIFTLQMSEVCEAIESMANPGGKKNAAILKHPTVAINMQTLIKTIANRYAVKCLKTNKAVEHEKVKIFVTCFENEFQVILARVCTESRGFQRRHQSTELPETVDVIFLLECLTDICAEKYNIL